MLACPKSPLLRVSLVVSVDVSSNVLDRAGCDGVADDLLTPDLRSFMHGDSHLVAGGRVVDLLHPYPHHMHVAQDEIACLLSCVDTWKNCLDRVSLNAALVRKHVSRLPPRSKSSNCHQRRRHSVAVLTAQEEVRTNIPIAAAIAKIEREEAPSMLVGVMGGVNEG